MTERNIRIGHGYDAHRLAEGRKLILGGVEIEHEKGLDGVSDADVLLHAVIDAVFGALADGDIGKHFPPDDKKYLGISSMSLARETCHIMKAAGYVISNIDSTIIAQRPKLAGYLDAMRENIADAFDAEKSDVSVKATTEEKMGFTGAQQGISCHAVVIICRQ